MATIHLHIPTSHETTTDLYTIDVAQIRTINGKPKLAQEPS